MTRPSNSWRPFLSETTKSWESEVLTQASVLALCNWVSENYQLIKDRFMNSIPVNVIQQPEKSTITRHIRTTETHENY